MNAVVEQAVSAVGGSVSDDPETDDAEAASAPDAAAVGLALAGASREKADSFLARQSDYLRLQMEDLHEQRDLTLSHLRWRRFSDWMRVGWQTLFCLLLAVAAVALLVAVIQASRARDLVIDPLVVPSSVADRGLSGEAAAELVIARLNQMSANTLSYAQAGGAYRDAAGQDLKVVIPQTGISIGQLNQYLRSSLGNETHIGGAILQSGNRLTLTVRFGDTAIPPVTEIGGDLDRLIQRAAEGIFLHDRPLRFADYLISQGRYAEALQIVRPLSVRGPTEDRANALSNWGQILLAQGDIDGAARRFRLSGAEQPGGAGLTYLGFLDLSLGHQQKALQELRNAFEYWRRANTYELGDATTAPFLKSNVSSLEGDFKGAAGLIDDVLTAATDSEVRDLNVAQKISFLAQDHDAAAIRTALDELIEPNAMQWAVVSLDIALQDWRGAAAAGDRANKSMKPDSVLAPYAMTSIWCDWASAQAAVGEFKSADARIALTSPDSDICALDRGKIALAENDAARAAYWFATVERRAPDIPFADTDWGRMLFEQGRFTDAIGKLEAAHRKGPHFADPLELWGEVLVASNRSDLALAKFEEANRYAPNWGRLHLKWAEALYWTGREEDARKQLEIASSLGLSADELRALGHDSKAFAL